MSLSINPKDPNCFVSGSCDATAKVWHGTSLALEADLFSACLCSSACLVTLFQKHPPSTPVVRSANIISPLLTVPVSIEHCVFLQVWDIRSGTCTHTFAGYHGSDINSGDTTTCDVIQTTVLCTLSQASPCLAACCYGPQPERPVAFFPNGTTFGSGSDDATCRLFDMRAYGEVGRWKRF